MFQINFHYSKILFAQMQWNDTIHPSRVICFSTYRTSSKTETFHRVAQT